MLKGHRNFSLGNDNEVSYSMDEAAEAGIIVCYPPTGTVTQPGLDDADNIAYIPTGANDGVPLGLLLTEVLDYDPELVDVRVYKTSALVGEKVEIAKAGWYVTDQLKSGDTPGPGDTAYYAANGELSTAGTYAVGKFESDKDSNGFVRVRITLN